MAVLIVKPRSKAFRLLNDMRVFSSKATFLFFILQPGVTDTSEINRQMFTSTLPSIDISIMITSLPYAYFGLLLERTVGMITRVGDYMWSHVEEGKYIVIFFVPY